MLKWLFGGVGGAVVAAFVGVVIAQYLPANKKNNPNSPTRNQSSNSVVIDSARDSEVQGDISIRGEPSRSNQSNNSITIRSGQDTKTGGIQIGN